MIPGSPKWMHGGNILRKNRERKGYTQERVVEMMGISLRTYQNWETEKTDPDFGHVMAICECVFKIDVLDAITVARGAAVEN